MDANQDSKPTDEDLLESIWWWRVLIAIFGALVVGWYSWNFGLKPAETQDKWGQFGDYLGGLLNPVVAFAAFYWLTQSVKLQKQELADTRAELEKATKAQEQLVKNGQRSIEIAALTALLDASNSEVSRLKTAIQDIHRHRPSTDHGFQYMEYENRNTKILIKMQEDLAEISREQDKYRRRLVEALDQATANTK